MNNEKKEYWDKYYKNRLTTNSPPKAPSQFAAFVAQEINPEFSVIDVGCGNGRDSIFFAAMGFNVLGIDESQSAIEVCREGIGALGTKLSFECCSVSEDKFEKLVAEKTTGPLVIYSRFFIHAISIEEEEIFFKKISNMDQVRIVALEFRTHRDLNQPKATPDHFRRYIYPSDFSRRAFKIGFKVSFFTEGFGFARYRNDDAHVARFLLTV